jgi:serine/threonine-protein kinase RsbW
MPQPAVRIEIPASAEYLALVRAAATGLAAGLHFTYEEIDDLRIAVDEACGQLLARRGAAETLTVDYQLDGAALRIRVTVAGEDPDQPLPRDTFAWQILRALTDEVDEHVDQDGRHLAFRKRGGTG